MAGRHAGAQATHLVTVVLANNIARIVWALVAHGGSDRTPAAVV